MDKKLETIKEDEVFLRKRFWRDPRTPGVFNLFIQGKDIPTIAEVTKLKPLTIEGMVTNKFFVEKLESHFRGVLFTNQVAKVIAASDVFTKLWDRVTDNIEEIPVEICLKELVKMFPQQKKEGMIVNPKNMNVFVNAMKAKGNTDPVELKDRLAEIDDMGFEGLEEDDDAEYPELQESNNLKQEDNGEQQRDSKMDPEKSSTD